MRTIIRNGHIIDGSGEKGYFGDVLFEEGKILSAAPQIEGSFDRVIDARGLVVCPGFIDTHSHSDVRILTEQAILPKLSQGITTEILGQDGVSLAPLPKKYVSSWRKNIGGLEGDSDEISWDYPTTERYLRAIEQSRPTGNYAYLVPHGNIRLEVMGFSDTPANEEQLAGMEKILRREMEMGAVGMSTGLVYVPCVYATTQELVRLCKIVAEYDGVFMVHQRFEGNRILESMSELRHIARQSGVKLHISHFKITGKHNADKRFDAFKMLDDMKTEGIRVSFDQYPYTAGSTMLSRVIPPWAHVGGTDKLIERMKDSAIREKIRSDILHTNTVWDNMIEMSTPEGIVISSVTQPENQDFVGHNIVEIGEMMGSDSISAAMDLLIKENNCVGMVCHNGVEEVMRDIMVRPEMNVCTDGLLGGTPHPRVYGAFPRVLGRYVREEGLLSLETAIHKMTQKAAVAAGIRKRGLIKAGFMADILLIDPNNVIDRGDYANPRQYARGIMRVIINGTTVISGNDVYGSTACGVLIWAR